MGALQQRCCGVPILIESCGNDRFSQYIAGDLCDNHLKHAPITGKMALISPHVIDKMAVCIFINNFCWKKILLLRETSLGYIFNRVFQSCSVSRYVSVSRQFRDTIFQSLGLVSVSKV